MNTKSENFSDLERWTAVYIVTIHKIFLDYTENLSAPLAHVDMEGDTGLYILSTCYQPTIAQVLTYTGGKTREQQSLRLECTPHPIEEITKIS